MRKLRAVQPGDAVVAQTTGARVEYGVKDTPGGPRIYIAYGADRIVLLTPERAEEHVTELSRCIIECRNGGQVA